MQNLIIAIIQSQLQINYHGYVEREPKERHHSSYSHTNGSLGNCPSMQNLIIAIIQSQLQINYHRYVEREPKESDHSSYSHTNGG